MFIYDFSNWFSNKNIENTPFVKNNNDYLKILE